MSCCLTKWRCARVALRRSAFDAGNFCSAFPAIRGRVLSALNCLYARCYGGCKEKKLYPPEQKARLAGGDYTKPAPFQRFVRGKCYTEDGQLYAKPVGIDKSRIVTSIQEADCLIVIPPGVEGSLTANGCRSSPSM
ncbi:MAG: hypothetical protein RBR24_01225 [Candidatus Carbobacillus sp.]|nr:hypothetical protein [Candidatus Carbobacillus sp.]